MDKSDWNRRYADTDLMWGAGPNRFVAEELSEVAPGRALDLAAGEGRNAIWLAERGWKVDALDFSDVAIDRGKRLAAERGAALSWHVADATTYEPDAGAYDLVLLCYLQLPSDQLRQVLAHATRGVAPGGILLVIAHDSRNLTEGYGGPKSPTVLYGPDDLRAALAELAPSMTIERAETVERPVETADGRKVALDVLVRARA